MKASKMVSSKYSMELLLWEPLHFYLNLYNNINSMPFRLVTSQKIKNIHQRKQHFTKISRYTMVQKSIPSLNEVIVL